MTEQHNMHNRDKILEEMAEYICDKRCRYPYEAEQEELDVFMGDVMRRFTRDRKQS